NQPGECPSPAGQRSQGKINQARRGPCFTGPSGGKLRWTRRLGRMIRKSRSLQVHMLRFRFLSAFLVCASALVSPSIASAQAKIGVVNFQKAIADTAELKKAEIDLVAQFKPQEDEYVKV